MRFYPNEGMKKIGVGEANAPNGSKVRDGVKNSNPSGRSGAAGSPVESTEGGSLTTFSPPPRGGGTPNTRLPTIHEDTVSVASSLVAPQQDQQQRLEDLEARTAQYKPSGLVSKERAERAGRRETLMARLGLALGTSTPNTSRSSEASTSENGSNNDGSSRFTPGNGSPFPLIPAANAHRGSAAREALRMLLGGEKGRKRTDEQVGAVTTVGAGGTSGSSPTGKTEYEEDAPRVAKPSSRMVDVGKWSSGGSAANGPERRVFGEDSSSGDEDGLMQKKKKKQTGGGFSPLRARFRGFGPLTHGLGPHVVVVRNAESGTLFGGGQQRFGRSFLGSRTRPLKIIQPAGVAAEENGDSDDPLVSNQPHQEIFWPTLDLGKTSAVQALVRRAKRGEKNPRLSDDESAQLAEQVTHDIFLPLIRMYLEFVESKMSLEEDENTGLQRPVGLFYKLRVPTSLVRFTSGGGDHNMIISSEDKARVVTTALKDARGSKIRSELGADRFEKVQGLASVHLNFDEDLAPPTLSSSADPQTDAQQTETEITTQVQEVSSEQAVATWRRAFRQFVSGITRQRDHEWLEVCDRLRRALEALETFEAMEDTVAGDAGFGEQEREPQEESASVSPSPEQLATMANTRKKLEAEFEAALEQYVKMREEREVAAQARAARRAGGTS